jgi:DNA-binding NarL/FixJ family response regulator
MTDQPSPVPRELTVCIVEDDGILRDSFSALVDGLPEYRVVAAVGTVAEGRAALDALPDVALVDLALPDGSGLELISHARRHGDRIKILVISVFGDVRSVVGAIEQGADGYLLKDSDALHIDAAIRTVVEGGAPISPAVASHILARLRGGRPGPAASSPLVLTDKETKVLESLAKGLTFREVAIAQSISHHTVGDHVKAIYRKLSVNSRAEAVFKALQSGLIRLDEPPRS